MKRNLIINGVLGLLMAGGMASCASDYLDTPPMASITDYQVGQTTENLAKAINGIGWMMNYPAVANGSVDGGGYPCGSTGEAYMMSFFDCFGGDTYQYHFCMFQSGGMARMEYFDNANFYTSAKPWGFYYTLARQANAILEKVDDAEESIEGQRDQIKAQALCFRAHSYIRLLQMFGPRWSDSNNGERKCIVLRLKQSTDPMPLVSMNTVLDQIYMDLEEAISLFEAEGTYKERPTWATPTLEVACGLLARAALLQDDWATAEKMAEKAQNGHSIMTNDQWCNGFMEANSDYLWTNSVDQPNDVLTNISWGAYNACNGNYATYWEQGCGNINMDLVRLLDPKDIRLTRFVIPQNINQKVENWWNPTYCGSLNMFVYKPSGTSKAFSRALYTYVASKTPTHSQGLEVITGYTDIAGRGLQPTIVFGSQLKFYVFGGSDQLNQYPYMRSTEMLLTQAEAAYMQGKTETAQNLISKLTTMRIPGSSPITKTGQALLDEIRLQRRIELWGEGTNFFDLKRWGMSNVRTAWVEGDVNSGNTPSSYAINIRPDQANHWVLRVPKVETDYNSAIDISELDW